MKLVQICCQNCGSSVFAEEGVDILFCTHCGSKVYIDGQSDTLIKAKTTIKVMDKLLLMREKRYAQRRFEIEAMADKSRLDAEAANNQRLYELLKNERNKPVNQHTINNKGNSLSVRSVFIGLFLIIALIFGTLSYLYYKGSKQHNQEVARLESLLLEVQEDVERNDYTSALFKAEQLYYSIDWSGESKEQWDQTREMVISMIMEAKEEGGK